MLGEEDALWAEFAAESEEHLDGIEAALAAAAPGAEAVNTLFRAFHSLKGMSDALGAQGLKALAHAAEDVLGLVRAGRLPLDRPLAELLLRTVDTLRRQRRQVLEHRPEQPADPALMAALRRFAGTPSAPPAGAAPVPPAAADPLLATLASRARAAVPLLAA
ncbi:Hpt domain-containing protein, partial [Teichococcus aestuarii]|uniref:Hpt domain-containing protein n=1 Tax=Teichococcus aestuarii TaxID=568898 RepID=UPI0036197431